MRVTAAAVQAAPILLNLEATLEKTLGLIEEAASKGARLVAFPETWLPGYPAWLDHCPGAALWEHEPAQAVFARLRANSVIVPGPVTERIGQAAKRAGTVVGLGVHERVEEGPGRGTLFNTLLIFDADGRLAHRHRKLVPTYTERLLWGQGDGSSLHSVNTRAGRVGGLICWEHWMPLARQALHESGEDIHLAQWPMVHERHQLASRHFAFEGRCFVIASGALMRARDLPPGLPPTDELQADPDRLILRGGSAIIGPDGEYVTGPVFDEETILITECDFDQIAAGKMTLDVAGHYARPDVFEFRVQSRPAE